MSTWREGGGEWRDGERRKRGRARELEQEQELRSLSLLKCFNKPLRVIRRGLKKNNQGLVCKNGTVFKTRTYFKDVMSFKSQLPLPLILAQASHGTTFQIGTKHSCLKKRIQSIFKLLNSFFDIPAVGLFHSVRIN